MATESGRRGGRRVVRGAPAAAALSVMVAIVAAGCAAAPQPSSSTSAPSEATTSDTSTPASAGSDETFTVSSGGHERTVILHVPAHEAGRELPLVLVYHGALDTAQNTAQSTGFLSASNSRGYAVAFLQGYQDTWNEGAGHTPAEQAGIDDVAFTSAALAAIEERVPIDTAAVAATGLSNGALMVGYLGCRLADQLSAIIPVAGPLPVSVAADCRPSRPLTVLQIHGTDDESIPYDGGHFDGVGGGTTVLSAPKAAALWAQLDGCTASAATTSPQSDVRITAYEGCPAGVTVKLRTLVGGGHDWPDDIGDLVADTLGLS
jgi:polyhydroxybutyrate depolymerase